MAEEDALLGQVGFDGIADPKPGAARGGRGRVEGSAPAVGGSGATGDVLDGDETLGRVEVVENAIVADSSTPAEAGAFETNDVAGVRVIRHSAQHGGGARGHRAAGA